MANQVANASTSRGLSQEERCLDEFNIEVGYHTRHAVEVVWLDDCLGAAGLLLPGGLLVYPEGLLGLCPCPAYAHPAFALHASATLGFVLPVRAGGRRAWRPAPDRMGAGDREGRTLHSQVCSCGAAPSLVQVPGCYSVHRVDRAGALVRPGGCLEVLHIAIR